MGKLESSIPGFAYNPARDRVFKRPLLYLEGRKLMDGAEGLWRVGNKLYDLQDFARNHPGGAEWIRLTKGTDITEAFESHHISDKASKLLPKFYIREAASPRSVPLTFEPNGFYKTFQKRAFEALKGVNFHLPSRKSNLISDSLAVATITFCLIAAKTQCWIATLMAGVFLTWVTITGHNYFHMRDNFRMYYFDLSIMSSKEWRITHVMSHHMYPNTLWDHEVYAVEPFLQWLPKKDKSLFVRVITQLISPIVWMALYIEQGIFRYYSVLFDYCEMEFRDFVPFILPLSMSLVAPSIPLAFKTWFTILLISSFLFGYIGFNAAHHHPDIFHDGDIYRDDLDWGLLELDAVRDRKVIDDSAFLVLTNFGSHALHHLLPTVDHSYLPLCLPAFIETCKEFSVQTDKTTQWELIKGQFQQLARTEPKKNFR